MGSSELTIYSPTAHPIEQGTRALQENLTFLSGSATLGRWGKKRKVAHVPHPWGSAAFAGSTVGARQTCLRAMRAGYLGYQSFEATREALKPPPLTQLPNMESPLSLSLSFVLRTLEREAKVPAPGTYGLAGPRDYAIFSF